MRITKDLINGLKSSYGHCANVEFDGSIITVRHKNKRDILYTLPNDEKFIKVANSQRSQVYEWINS